MISLKEKKIKSGRWKKALTSWQSPLMLVPWTLLSKICRQAIKEWDQNNQRTVKLGNWSFPEFHVFCLTGSWVQSQRPRAVHFIECLLLKRCWNERHWRVTAFVLAGLETEGSADKKMYSPLQEDLTSLPASISGGSQPSVTLTLGDTNGFGLCRYMHSCPNTNTERHRNTL